jgi:putative spermidine/putrescine transport system substrate-binding protein
LPSSKDDPVVADAKLDPDIAKLPGVSPPRAVEEPGDHHRLKLRAEKTAEWRKWFAENIMN